MKKLFLSIAVIALGSTPLLSQEKVIKENKFSDNWFVQAQAGASYTFSESNRDASVGDLINPTFALSVGKHFSPLLGLRAQIGGYKSRSRYAGVDDTYGHRYYRGTIDGMMNFTNLFLAYDKDRAFNVYGLAGISAIHASHKNINPDLGNTSGLNSRRLEASNMIVPRVGVQADYALCDKLSVNLELTANLLEDRFNGRVEGKAYDGMLTAMAGVTYYIGKKGFDVMDYVDPSQISALNDRINQQRADLNSKDSRISDLQRELAQKPKEIIKEKEVLQQEESTEMNAVVVFKLGKSELQDNQEINIFNAAKYFQQNPDMNIIITGYADKATGNPTINQKISEKRAETVAKIMVDKFGINPNRITTQASGDKTQPFQNDAWNRVVIFTAVKKK